MRGGKECIRIQLTFFRRKQTRKSVGTIVSEYRRSDCSNLIAQLDDYCLQDDVDKQLSREFWTGPFGVFEIQGTKLASRSSEPPAEEETTDAAASGRSTTDMSGGHPHHHAQTAEVGGPGPTTSSPQDVASNESSIEEIENLRQDDMFSVLEDFDVRLLRLSPQLDFWQLEDQLMHDLSMPLDMIDGDFTGLDFFDNLTDAPAAGGAAEASDQANIPHHPSLKHVEYSRFLEVHQAIIMANRGQSWDAQVHSIANLREYGSQKLPKMYRDYYNEGAMDLVT